jgi:hypothetical protein
VVQLFIDSVVSKVYGLVVERSKTCDHDICSLFQAFGRTPLTNISPKKTLEGALAGLAGCVLTTVLLSTVLRWPRSLLRYDIWNLYYYCVSKGTLLSSSKLLYRTSEQNQGSEVRDVLIRHWT